MAEQSEAVEDVRQRYAEAIRSAADLSIIGEWICCDPVNPDHDLCMKGDIARQMLRAVLADDPEVLFVPSRLVDAVMAVRDEETERLRAVAASCTCPDSPMMYAGPEADCPVHGAVRALNEAMAEIERLRLAADPAKVGADRACRSRALAAEDALARLIPPLECVLMDHAGELDGETGQVDANLAEMAAVYQEMSGFDARAVVAEGRRVVFGEREDGGHDQL